LLFLASGVLGALSFHVVATALTDWPTSAIGRSIFVFSLASLAGYVVPFVPSGAGVREAVILGALGPTLGPGPALSVAVVSRAVAVLVDAALGGTIALAYLPRVLRRGFRSSARATAAKMRT
jgi:uncharacterized membrane protein YbhN (UPF0104 family)